MVKWFDGSIARIHLNLGQRRPAAAATGTENWLLVGTDSRAGSGGEYGNAAGERSDTTILAHLDASGVTTNVSFPRDTLVTIPAYTSADGQTHPAHKDKFNAAISLGGPSLLIRTIEQLTGIRIDHYVSVDLVGFKQVSQAVGGVQVCLLPSSHVETTSEAGITHVSTNVDDSYSGFHGKVGVQTVVGDQALAFVRQRHGLVNGDIGRIQRQQQFLGAVFRKATATNILLDPLRVERLLAAFKGALTLDQHTSLADLERLALRLKNLGASGLQFETIPQRSLSPSDTGYGRVFTDSGGILELIPAGQTQSVGSVQILDQPAFRALINQLKAEPPVAAKSRSAAVPPPPTPRAPAVLVPPSQVLVYVKNGIGRPGLAAAVTRLLASQGFRTGAPANVTGGSYPRSLVLFPPDARQSAQTVAHAIPGAVLRQDATLTNGITLIVGANYTRVDAVHAGQSEPAIVASPTSGPTKPGLVPPPVTAASAGNHCTY